MYKAWIVHSWRKENMYTSSEEAHILKSSRRDASEANSSSAWRIHHLGLNREFAFLDIWHFFLNKKIEPTLPYSHFIDRNERIQSFQVYMVKEEKYKREREGKEEDECKKWRVGEL